MVNGLSYPVYTQSPPFGFVACLESSVVETSISLPARLAGAHDKRKQEWVASRVALLSAFDQAGLKVDPSTLDSANKQQLDKVRDWNFSLSHTEGLAVAWIVARSAARGLGVDVELRSRVFSKDFSDRLSNSLDLLECGINLWSAKEAAYKSLYLLGLQEGTDLKSIVIGENSFTAAGMNGLWVQAQDQKHLITYAWIT